MAYIARNYENNVAAPKGSWVCTRTSKLVPFTNIPPVEKQGNPDFCGQCVSFATTVCPTLPVSTSRWKQGDLVQGATTISKGTVIATFNKSGRYAGHVAIYVSQSSRGIQVMDQYVAGIRPSAISLRTIRWKGTGVNAGGNFHVVD